jgi:cytochrome c oxidase subunit 3
LADDARARARLGMWAFLATEALFFGGLFLGYAVYREAHPEVFVLGSRHLELALGTANTMILLTSSFTMALAVHSAERERWRRLVALLAATFLLGVVFLGVKGYEYSHTIRAGLLPGPSFAGAEPQEQIFYAFYFAMTGLHAVHMLVGLGILAILAAVVGLRRGVGTSGSAIEMTGLYWHFVDSIWIFLFPLLYLVGRHT